MSKVEYLFKKSKNKKKDVLIIEESSNIREYCQKLLDNSTYNLHFKNNITDLCCFIENKTPDLILIDISLTRMNAFNILKMLKLQENTKNIPVIFTTFLDSGDNISLGIELGAADYIISPFDNKEFLRKIRKALR